MYAISVNIDYDIFHSGLQLEESIYMLQLLYSIRIYRLAFSPSFILPVDTETTLSWSYGVLRKKSNDQYNHGYMVG